MWIILNVPKMKQSTMGTCGSISLLMVMSYLGHIQSTSSLEFKIWRESALFPMRMSNVEGLAIISLKEGYNVIMFKESSKFIIPRLNKDFINYESLGGRVDLERACYFTYSQQRETLKEYSRRWKEINRKICIEDVKKLLKLGLPIIVLINTKDLYNEDMLHWVVVKGIDCMTKKIYINDPLDRVNEVNFDLFEKITKIDSKYSQAIVIFKNDIESIIKELRS